jgi:hypothetical protein
MSTSVSDGAGSVNCPACGAVNDLYDLLIDGQLRPLKRFACQACAAEVTIDAIDWEPTLYCSAPTAATPSAPTVEPEPPAPKTKPGGTP